MRYAGVCEIALPSRSRVSIFWLCHCGDGICLGKASKQLIVSATNITLIVQNLIEDGYIIGSQGTDLLKQIIQMTPAGRWAFRDMAQAHTEWIVEFMSDLPPEKLTGPDRRCCLFASSGLRSEATLFRRTLHVCLRRLSLLLPQCASLICQMHR